MVPNLFHYAPTELSQDAFFCWLLAWADVGNANADPSCHRAGLAFLNALVGIHGESPIENATVNVYRQIQGADIVAEIGGTLVVLIEDKVHAGIHGDQLTRYLANTAAHYPGRKILPLFLKTGDQSNYRQVEQAGYRLFLRSDVLRVLKRSGDNVRNAIFLDFLANVERQHSEVESYAVKPVPTWVQEWDPWVGFYKRLQLELDEKLEWDYVPNARGGFMGAWWHTRKWIDPITVRTHEVYLQIEQGPLCFKIAVGNDEIDRAAVRRRWHERLMAASREIEVGIERPARMGNGTGMTVGRRWDKWLGSRRGWRALHRRGSQPIWPSSLSCGPSGYGMTSWDHGDRLAHVGDHRRRGSSWGGTTHRCFRKKGRPTPFAADKYLQILERKVMDLIEREDDPTFDERLGAQRDIVRQSLDAIANEIGMAMRDVGLTFPVYMTVRNSETRS